MVPTAGNATSRNMHLACRPAQRHVHADLCQPGAKLPATPDGRLPSLPRHALQRRSPRAVQPQSTKGPWKVIRSALAISRRFLPGCHQVHREGALEARPQERISVAGQPVHDSLAFFDRREACTLPHGAHHTELHDGARTVKVSQDQARLSATMPRPATAEAGTWPRPMPGTAVGSGDDRTPMECMRA